MEASTLETKLDADLFALPVATSPSFPAVYMPYALPAAALQTYSDLGQSGQAPSYTGLHPRWLCEHCKVV